MTQEPPLITNNAQMLITNINARPDWFLASHTLSTGKILHETAHNRHTAIALLFLKVKTHVSNMQDQEHAKHIHININNLALEANPFSNSNNL